MNPALDQFAETAATLEKDARETADMAPDPARRPAAPELEVIVVRDSPRPPIAIEPGGEHFVGFLHLGAALTCFKKPST
ncbi:hypothetical protein [Rhodococcus pyridinivorans]|uniref:hypothetical protein n=1 Tax=Rhodococcus pyridinivorans TaxID=103816 RepID=UPI00030DBF5F|nr:hypothetical protein [Rhodococcus pyridinivorans]